jgi:hypothetical protein
VTLDGIVASSTFLRLSSCWRTNNSKRYNVEKKEENAKIAEKPEVSLEKNAKCAQSSAISNFTKYDTTVLNESAKCTSLDKASTVVDTSNGWQTVTHIKHRTRGTSTSRNVNENRSRTNAARRKQSRSLVAFCRVNRTNN